MFLDRRGLLAIIDFYRVGPKSRCGEGKTDQTANVHENGREAEQRGEGEKVEGDPYLKHFHFRNIHFSRVCVCVCVCVCVPLPRFP